MRCIKGILTPVYVATEEQAADALTKALRPSIAAQVFAV